MSYSARGRTAASQATADVGVAALWNPHATQRIKVIKVGIFVVSAPSAGAGVKLRRITARGTPGSTVTPGIQNHSTRGVAPVSGALLDLAQYSVQPTFDTGDLDMPYEFPAVTASGIIYPDLDIEIPPGAGLCITTDAAVAVTAANVVFKWLEDWDGR